MYAQYINSSIKSYDFFTLNIDIQRKLYLYLDNAE